MEFKNIGDVLGDSMGFEFLEKMAGVNSPGGDPYEGKTAEEILIALDNSRKYRVDVYDCPVCLNKGGKTHYNFETNTTYWVPCGCNENKKTLINTEKSGLGDLLNYRINDFKVTSEFQKHMKETAVHYILNAKKEWFVASGQPGCGKTMLCSAICAQQLKNGKVVKYIVWNEFLSKLKSMKYDKERSEFYEQHLNAEVLYIDDMLKGKVSDYERDTAFQIINYRYNNNLQTVISTELLVNDLRDLDEALASRMYQKATSKYVLEIERDHNKNYRFM